MMKNILLALLIFVSSHLCGQVRQLTNSTTVKDENGKILPYESWQQLMVSGNYRLSSKGEKDANGEAILILERMSEEQKAARDQQKALMVSKLPKPRTSDAFVEGQIFKGDKLNTVNGQKLDLRKNTDKIYVINFWFIDCPPCKQEIPDLNALVARYQEHPEVVFVAIALDGYPAMKQFLKKTGFEYQIVADGRYYADKYGVKSYPTHVIVGKDNIIKFSTVGLATNTVSWIQKTIDEQLATK